MASIAYPLSILSTRFSSPPHHRLPLTPTPSPQRVQAATLGRGTGLGTLSSCEWPGNSGPCCHTQEARVYETIGLLRLLKKNL